MKIYHGIILILGCLLAGSCVKNERLQYALAFAGDNRAELEKVLEHYRDSGLKYDAACFLIENMPYYYTYADFRLDSLKAVQAGIFYKKHLDSETREKWRNFSYRNLPRVYDAHVITASYLIENIDLAFAAWQKRPWKNTLTFDDFCEWILPYRIGDEPLENWRSVFYKKFSCALDSLYRGTDVVEAAALLMPVVYGQCGDEYSDELSLPHLGALYLLKHCIGYCRESCDITLYAFRAAGIPVATDFLLSAPEAQGGHSWNVLKDTSGIVAFEYGAVARNYDDRRLKGKVYRQCFGRQKEKFPGMSKLPEVPLVIKNLFQKEVTSEYFGKNAVEIELDEKSCGTYVYPGVFSSEGWKPVDIARQRNGKAEIENIEPGVIFFPLAPDGKGWRTVGYPFWLTGGGLAYFRPDKEVERVELLRKYPLRKWTRYHISEIVGSRFEASETPDFRQAERLYLVTDTPKVSYNEVICHPGKKYRYVRYKAAEDRLARIAELMLFRSADDSVKIDVKVVAGSAPDAGNASVVKEKICDGDYLTYFLSDENGGYAILDLGKPEWIGKLAYVPRNDENFIRIGDKYELFYQNGAAGWASLGRKVATEPKLVYDNVPRNALLLLHNLSRGREEQTFFMQDGKQVFLNKW